MTCNCPTRWYDYREHDQSCPAYPLYQAGRHLREQLNATSTCGCYVRMRAAMPSAVQKKASYLQGWRAAMAAAGRG